RGLHLVQPARWCLLARWCRASELTEAARGDRVDLFAAPGQTAGAEQHDRRGRALRQDEGGERREECLLPRRNVEPDGARAPTSQRQEERDRVGRVRRDERRDDQLIPLPKGDAERPNGAARTAYDRAGGGAGEQREGGQSGRRRRPFGRAPGRRERRRSRSKEDARRPRRY